MPANELISTLAETIRQALAAGVPLPRAVRADVARLLIDGGTAPGSGSSA